MFRHKLSCRFFHTLQIRHSGLEGRGKVTADKPAPSSNEQLLSLKLRPDREAQGGDRNLGSSMAGSTACTGEETKTQKSSHTQEEREAAVGSQRGGEDEMKALAFSSPRACAPLSTSEGSSRLGPTPLTGHEPLLITTKTCPPTP